MAIKALYPNFHCLPKIRRRRPSTQPPAMPRPAVATVVFAENPSEITAAGVWCLALRGRFEVRLVCVSAHCQTIGDCEDVTGALILEVMLETGVDLDALEFAEHAPPPTGSATVYTSPAPLIDVRFMHPPPGRVYVNPEKGFGDLVCNGATRARLYSGPANVALRAIGTSVPRSSMSSLVGRVLATLTGQEA